MALEDLTGTNKFISSLVVTNPTAGDPVEQGDDHIRGVKNVLVNQFPNLTAAVTKTAAELNAPYPAVPVAANAPPPAEYQSTGSIGGQTDQYALEDHRHPSSGLGQLDQGYWNVVREPAINYVNNTSKPIMLFVHGTLSVSYAYIVIEVGGVTIGGCATASSSYAAHSAVIPPGYTYRWYPSSGTLTNVTCRELREGAG